MRHLITLLSVIISIVSFGQNSVIDFVNKNMGKKVGSGVCHEFVVRAENQKYKNWNRDYYLHDDSMVAHQVYVDSAMAGDIIMFEGVTMDDSTKMNHIGIVCEKSGDMIVYASQNIGSYDDSAKKIRYRGQQIEVFSDSKVVRRDIDVKKIVSGWVYIFRF